MAEIELQQELSFAHQAKYRQQVVEARQQAELQRKVLEARQLEQKLLQADSQSFSLRKHAELKQKVSEARVFQQKISAQKQTEHQRRMSEEGHFAIQQQLSEVRKLRYQLSKARQADLQQKFSETKHAELALQAKNTDQQVSAARQVSLEQELSESRRAAMKQEQINKFRQENELQNLLKETLILDQQEAKSKRRNVWQAKGNSEQMFLCTHHSNEMHRSLSAPKAQKWLMFANDNSNGEFVESKAARKLSSEKAIQTTLSHQRNYEVSSSSTPLDSTSTDEMGQYLRGGGGPTAISPRPPSAHPMRRPDLYAKHRQQIAQEEGATWHTESAATTIGGSNAAVESLCLLAKDSARSCPISKEAKYGSGPNTVTTLSESRLPCRSKEINKLQQSREEITTGTANSMISSVCYSSSHEKKISFMVSLPCGEEKREINTSEVSVSPASSSDSTYSLTDENMRPSSKLETSVLESSKVPSPLPQDLIIDNAREGSSIISHVDSLILMEQGASEPLPMLSAKESQDVIEKVQAESCIVQHVDSLILIEQSMQSMQQLDEPVKVRSSSSYSELNLGSVKLRPPLYKGLRPLQSTPDSKYGHPSLSGHPTGGWIRGSPLYTIPYTM